MHQTIGLTDSLTLTITVHFIALSHTPAYTVRPRIHGKAKR